MTQPRRGSWSVTALNSVVAVTVLVVVAVLALVVNPPAPPGIAAFAPQATKVVKKAPPAQSARSGEGAGECGAGQVCAGPSPTPSPSTSASPVAVPSPTGPAEGVPSALQCYKWPDGSVTQTFDPQSPPCIATWDEKSGNGGATSKGVTGSQIDVALPVGTSITTWPQAKPLVDFFNSRFQLYGRQIRIVPITSTASDRQGQGYFNEPEPQRADAAQVVAQKVFASFDFVDPLHYNMSLPVFRDVLTKHKVISLAGGDNTAFGTQEDLERHAPYEWTFYPTIDVVVKNVATMVCRSLVGKPAAHAVDPALRDDTRRFAIVMPTQKLIGGPLPGLPAMRSILDGCGISGLKVVEYDFAAGNRPALTASFRSLAADGVTSALYFPYGGNSTSQPLVVAGQAGFKPEWITMANHKYLTDHVAYAPDQVEGVFGVGPWNKMPQLELEMWAQAFLAAGGDGAALSNGQITSGRALYNELLLLASGIQLAGPDLTPASFAAGLQSTVFPNPGAGAAPTFQGSVGFTPGDVTMLDDLNAFWMTKEMSGSDVTTSRNNNTSKLTCYAGRGRRFSIGTWPTRDVFFDGGCR